MPMVPRVNKGECISCGVCVDTCPAVFRFDADNRAEVYDPQGADAAAIQEAIDLCPVACIYWDEGDDAPFPPGTYRLPGPDGSGTIPTAHPQSWKCLDPNRGTVN